MYVLLGMSAESFHECEMGESLMVKQSYHLTLKKKKKKEKEIVSLVFLISHSPAEHIYNSRNIYNPHKSLIVKPFQFISSNA